MAKFEVYIPAVGAGSFDLTFRVEAENWLGALNTGLKKIGEKGGAGTNFLVDIQDDNSIHVTDPKSHRVFRITEMEPPPETEPTAPMTMPPGAAAAPEPNPFDPLPGRATQLDLPAVQAPSPKSAASDPATLPPMPAMEFVPPAAKPASDARPSTEKELQPAFNARATLPGLPPQALVEPARNDAKNAAPPLASTVPSAPPTAANPRPPSIPPAAFNPARPPSNTARPKSGYNRKPSGIATNVTEVPRQDVRPPTGRIGRDKPEKVENVDDVLAELFDRVQEMENFSTPEEALEFVLDLAMAKIAAEAGSIFLADLSTNDLTLGTARGPKSKELMRLNPRVPMGVGIVGFCAQEGLSLAISDAQRDPRFYRAISERIGYPTQSILCVPMIRAGRSFGCLEVLTKKSSSRFTEGEVAILGYLADAASRYLDSVG